ncbi:MAG: protease inhibitor I42 family protein [Verrucomicrobia subdivision 3 bacterium]|nr:protease inhibitor I42 family protein [Limisphaerales bacterium]
MKKTNLLLAIVLAVFTLNAWAALCPKCSKLAYISSIGKCTKCENHTSSGAFKLCKTCSTQSGKCAHCEQPVVGKIKLVPGPAPAPNPDPVAPPLNAPKVNPADIAKVKTALEAWAKAKMKCGGNYQYTVGFSSAFGFGHTTTIIVKNNQVVGRVYEEFNRRAGPGAAPNGFVENETTVGKNKKGAPAKTLDEIYKTAAAIAAKALPPHEVRYVRTDKQGLLTSCFVMDRRIADDAPRNGVALGKITLADKAGDKPKKVFKAPNGNAFPAHWGAPPLRQTRDLRPLPGGYGRGSGTLRKWIQENLAKDAKKKNGAIQIQPVPRPPIVLGLQAPTPNRQIPPPPRVVGRPAPTPVRELPAGDCAQCRTEAHQLHLGLAENGKTITVKQGSIVRVKLRGNPTTGFTWNNATPAGVLKLMGKVSPQSGGRPGLVGAPGMSTATFAATAIGKGTIVLHYNRVFENNKAPAKTVKINIAITKDGRAGPANPTGGNNAARIAELEREIAKLKDFARRARFTQEGLKAHQAKITKLEQELATLTAGKNDGAPTFETWVKGGMKIPRGRVFLGGSPWFDERKGERRSPREVYKMLYGGKNPPVVKPSPRPNPGKGRFPAHWGAPPRLQTKDLRPLPGGYGRGSSTLARWIQQNLDKDKANPNRGNGNQDPKRSVIPKKLSLKDAQGGVAGFTGWVTTVKVDGTWNRRQFFNQQLRPIEQQGKLTDAQAQAIKATMNTANIEKLPARLGKFSGANPHVLTLTFGDQQIVLTLPTGAKLETPQPGGKLTGADAFALVAHELAHLHKNTDATEPRIRPLPEIPLGALSTPAQQPRR